MYVLSREASQLWILSKYFLVADVLSIRFCVCECVVCVCVPSLFRALSPVELCENDFGRAPMSRRMRGDNMYGATNFSRRDIGRGFFLSRQLFSRNLMFSSAAIVRKFRSVHVVRPATIIAEIPHTRKEPDVSKSVSLLKMEFYVAGFEWTRLLF